MPLPTLTKPAVIASIAYIIMGFMVLLPFTPYIDDSTGGRQALPPPTFGYRLLILIIMLIPIALSVYSINCMMVGRCTVWSYVQAIAIAIWVILFATATIMTNRKI